MTDSDSLQLGLLEPCISLMKQGLQASTRGPTALAHVSKTLRHVLHLCTQSAVHISLKQIVMVHRCIACLYVEAASQRKSSFKSRPCHTYKNENPQWHAGALRPPG